VRPRTPTTKIQEKIDARCVDGSGLYRPSKWSVQQLLIKEYDTDDRMMAAVAHALLAVVLSAES
jgi:hypothetical protein